MKPPDLEHVMQHGKAPILGYKGYIPGKVSENVIGERQCKTVTLAGAAGEASASWPFWGKRCSIHQY